MMRDQAATIRREHYAPHAFRCERIALEFDLDAQRTLVTATLELERRAEADADAPLRLDGEELELLSVAVDGRALEAHEYHADERSLTVPHPPARLTLQTVVAIPPARNSTLSGLYASGDNLYTQCEAEGFRRITYFPDRPDVMSRYRVTLRGDATRYPVLLSNGNLVDEGRDGVRQWAVWEDPFPKPSYLFAIVAGRLVVHEERMRTGSGREVLLQIWVEPGNLDKTQHAMQSLQHAIRWDEERFGLELDLDRFMIVAVGDFNMGAMENKGLNIFNTKYVFANPRLATDADFANVESVVGHEYFHNWTGNRVTCRDWFQLTLKEGLTVFRDQEFSADRLAADAATEAQARSARAVKRIEDVRVLRTAQFPEDAGPMAHPIRPDSYQEINNFYTVTVYEKGAEVIRMMQTLVGRDGFRRGMDLYFERHDGCAVTCDDFVAAIADANGRDLEQFTRWYSQAGTPRLRARGRHDAAARRYELTLQQYCPPTPGQPHKLPFHFPVIVGLVGRDGRDVAQTTVEMTADEQTVVFEGIAEPPVPSLLREFSAPVVLEYPYTHDELAFLAAHDPDPFNRWEAAQRLAVAAILDVLAAGVANDAAAVAERAAVLIEAYRRVLVDGELDAAFREQVLALPAEGFVSEQIDEVDPVAVRAARNAVRAAIGTRLHAELDAVREAMSADAVYSPDPASAARRGLRNLALSYRVAAGDPAAWEAADAQQRSADNMTDRMAAVTMLVNSASPAREAALAAFERDFASEPLAMDKWFSAQATMHRQPDDAPVLERVRALGGHPAFSMRNPNKVRSLIGAFCTGNLAEFHAVDGSGYRFWAQQVVALDAINPQVAARVARALDRWRKFTPQRRQMMQAALQDVQAQARSADVLEVVGKALAAAEGHA